MSRRTYHSIVSLLLVCTLFASGSLTTALGQTPDNASASAQQPKKVATAGETPPSKQNLKPLDKIFAHHPAPADRRAASVALAARFPEREEYVINTSEFNRVKAQLLRLSNAKVSSAGEIKG